MKNLIFSLFLLSSLILIYCDNSNPVNGGSSYQYSIWYMDSLGNSLGGDSNNFCIKGNVGCPIIRPVYPNPVNKDFYINYLISADISCPDTISLFFTEGNDTNWIFKNKPYTTGSFIIKLNKDSLGYSNEIISLHLKRNNIHCICMANISLYDKCFNSGNIRFN